MRTMIDNIMHYSMITLVQTRFIHAQSKKQNIFIYFIISFDV